MDAILTPLRGEFFDQGRRFRLLEDLTFDDGSTRVIVPAGFITDFNSVPRGLWNVFPPWQFPEAGVVHDYLYQHPGLRSRQECDAVHKLVLQVLGCGWFKRQSAYLAIRMWGGAPWNRYRLEEQVAMAETWCDVCDRPVSACVCSIN
jgi:hypothetical protein